MIEMKRVFCIAGLLLLGGVLQTTAALAQAKTNGAKGGEPTGSIGSGAITATQFTKDLQILMTEWQGSVINFVLPRGWELVEEGIDKKTGKLKDDLAIYSLISRAPVTKKGDATDLLFELDIFKQGLLENLPADTPADQRNEPTQIKYFLNAQISMNIKAGAKCVTKPQDIVAKPYGPPTRPPTMFVPIFYEVPPPHNSKSKGSVLYTFTSVVDGKIWMLKFLVARDQIDNYGALIALVLNNSFAMTKAQYEEMLRQSKEKPAAKPGQGTSSGGAKPKTK
jgi:hypothetical protein